MVGIAKVRKSANSKARVVSKGNSYFVNGKAGEGLVVFLRWDISSAPGDGPWSKGALPIRPTLIGFDTDGPRKLPPQG